MIISLLLSCLSFSWLLLFLKRKKIKKKIIKFIKYVYTSRLLNLVSLCALASSILTVSMPEIEWLFELFSFDHLIPT